MGRRPRVYLHIGAMKTGTTYLQQLMGANQESLAEAGYLFPGETWVDQSRAVRDILFDTADARMRAHLDGMWAQFRDQMLDHRGRASIISMEFLSFADEERAQRIVDSLAGADVHAVLTVRDAAATIPSQWQTSCRNGGRLPYAKMLAGVRLALDGEDHQHRSPYRLFQRTQGIPRMLDAWVPVVGRKRMHVVTVPPRGSDPALLWRRFARVVRVDPGVVRLDEVKGSNPSLGLASTELLRLINIELGKVHPMDYRRVVRRLLARLVLSARTDLEQPVRLNGRGLNLAARWNGVVRDAIAAHRVPLVGSLKDLPTARPDPDTEQPLPAPTEAEMLSAAASARAGLTVLRRELTAADDRDRMATASKVLVSTAPDLADQSIPSAWVEAGEPLRAAVVEVAQLARDCMKLASGSPAEFDAGHDLDYLGGHVDEDPDDGGPDDERDDERDG